MLPVLRSLNFYRSMAFVFMMCNYSCASPDLFEKTEYEPQIHVVEISKFKFKPFDLKVNKGDTIRWINKDIFLHRVADKSRKKWTSRDLKTDDSFDLIVKEPSPYVCTLHPTMKANIYIKENY